MAQTAKQVRRPTLTIERLVDKADRLMDMQGLSATLAVRRAMPDELLMVPMADLRTLVESALLARLGARRSQARYRDNGQRAMEVQRLTQLALKRLSSAAQRKAEVLARVRYTVGGVPTPLIQMDLEGHRAMKTRAGRSAKTHAARRDFHEAAIRALKAADAATIADLTVAGITELADRAAQVWGEGAE